MDVALSPNGKRLLRVFFALVVVFLYAPIAILLVFSFNKSPVPSFPLSGFTLHWYREFLSNSDLRGALQTSAIVAAFSSTGAVILGILASLALTRRRIFARGAVSALLLSPLVIPYVVFGISLLLLFHQLDVARSLLTVVIGHVVISLPYTILVLVPRLAPIDRSLQEAGVHLRARRGGHLRPRPRPTAHRPRDHAAADPSRGGLGLPDRVHDLVRRVRGRLVRRRAAGDVPDLPLFGAPLPEPAAAGDRRRGGRAGALADRRDRGRGRPPGRGAAVRRPVARPARRPRKAPPALPARAAPSRRRPDARRSGPRSCRPGRSWTCRGRRPPRARPRRASRHAG